MEIDNQERFRFVKESRGIAAACWRTPSVIDCTIFCPDFLRCNVDQSTNSQTTPVFFMLEDATGVWAMPHYYSFAIQSPHYKRQEIGCTF